MFLEFVRVGGQGRKGMCWQFPGCSFPPLQTLPPATQSVSVGRDLIPLSHFPTSPPFLRSGRPSHEVFILCDTMCDGSKIIVSTGEQRKRRRRVPFSFEFPSTSCLPSNIYQLLVDLSASCCLKCFFEDMKRKKVEARTNERTSYPMSGVSVSFNICFSSAPFNWTTTRNHMEYLFNKNVVCWILIHTGTCGGALSTPGYLFYKD